MKAVVIRAFGSSEVLKYEREAVQPEPAPNQVLIKVRAAGINPLDWKTREGELAFFTGKSFPKVLGNDASGEIVEVGHAVSEFKPGDQVFCMVDSAPKPSWKGFAQSGAYAEYTVTRADTLARKPSNLSHVEAASIPLAALTAYQALRHRANTKVGDRILINGASGGVGTMAIQIAVAIGAEVVGVSSERNLGLIRALGAAHCLDYRTHDITNLNQQFDVIYDVAANLSYNACKNMLRDDGIFISNVANPGALLATWMAPVLKVFGVHKRNSFAWVRPSGADLARIAEMIEVGQLKPVIDRVFPMAEVAAAHDHGESGLIRGKSVIEID
ncbi:MAG: NAD(P)-dependent alcohol dehydrogenase [Pseudomonadales bacterium]